MNIKVTRENNQQFSMLVKISQAVNYRSLFPATIELLLYIISVPTGNSWALGQHRSRNTAQ